MLKPGVRMEAEILAVRGVGPATVELRRKGWAQRVTLETAQREAQALAPHAVREMVLTVPPVIVLRERALLEYRARSWKVLRAVPAERVR